MVDVMEALERKETAGGQIGIRDGREGWLLKRRKLRRGWKNRYVIVSGEELKYGDAPETTTKLIPLLACQVKTSPPSSSQQFTFSVKSSKSSRFHNFATDNEDNYQQWLQTIYVAQLGATRTKHSDSSEACVVQ